MLIKPAPSRSSNWSGDAFSHEQTRDPFSLTSNDLSVKNIVNHLQGDFISVLSLAQWRNVDFLPITWQPAMDQIGSGGSAKIQQSTMNSQMDFAFKRLSTSSSGLADDEALFRAIIAEISVLTHPYLRDHPNILRLEGICWDIDSTENKTYPALVFEKATHGDLSRFKASEVAKGMMIADKILICAHVAYALAVMHSCGIIHGDLKPANVLMIRDNEDLISAKVADFGYSTLALIDETIALPRSKPWSAPEWHHRGFTFDQARKQDLYSFALLCLWLLLPDKSSTSAADVPSPYALPDQYDPIDFEDIDSIERLKGTNQMRYRASKEIELMQDLDKTLKQNLLTFFKDVLSLDPGDRICGLDRFLTFLMYEGSIDIVQSHLNRGESEPLLPEPNFQVDESSIVVFLSSPLTFIQIAKSLDQFVKANFRVRQYIADCLEYQYYLHPERTSNLAFQLAFCYKLGFGRSHDENKCVEWLSRSNRDRKDLDSEIGFVKAQRSWQFMSKNAFLLNEKGFLDWAYFSEHQSLQQLQTAEVQYTQEIEDMQDILGKNHPVVLILRTTLALLVERKGDFQRSHDIQLQLMNDLISDPDYGPDHVSSLTSISNLASVLSTLGDFDKAEEMHRIVLSKSQGKPGGEDPHTLASANNLATIMQQKGEYKEAEKLQRQTLERRERMLGKRHSATLTSLNNLASILSLQGRLPEAECMHRRFVEEGKQVLGVEHPHVLSGMNNLAEVLESQGNLDEAEDIDREILRTKAEVLGLWHHSTLTTMNNLALVLQEQGNLTEAREMHRNALEGSERLFGTEHPATLTSMGNLAFVLDLLQEHEAAEEILRRTIECSVKVLGQESRDTLTYMNNLAGMLAGQQGYTEAEYLYRRACEGFEKALGVEHPDTRACRDSLDKMRRKIDIDTSKLGSGQIESIQEGK